MRAILLLLPLASLLQADVYTITDLGSLGGSSTMAYGINDSGTAVGFGQTGTGNSAAFISSGGGSIQKLSDLAGASDSNAYGINSSGTVVGTSYINGEVHGVVWSGGQANDLGTGIFAMGISDSGAVIGRNASGHAFVSEDGIAKDLGVLEGGGWSAAYGINSAGAVVGYGDTGNGQFRGFVWTADGGMTALGTLGGKNSYATAVDSGGDIVGHASVASGYEHAFLNVDGKMTDLGTLGGGSSYAYGINDGGTVVGYSWLASGENPHAFIYFDGEMMDLNSVIASGSGWELLGAYGINDAGQIVGEGLFHGQSHAFELDPEVGGLARAFGIQAVPEPGMGWLVGIAMGVIGLVRRRR